MRFHLTPYILYVMILHIKVCPRPVVCKIWVKEFFMDELIRLSEFLDVEEIELSDDVDLLISCCGCCDEDVIMN